MEKISYKTSRDMKRLKELLDSGYEVVCFYTYDFKGGNRVNKADYKPLMTTDLCLARLLRKGEEYEEYAIGCRGRFFIEYWTKGISYQYTFLELLEACDIQFIEPTIKLED